jgi:acyl-coenzyme A thioesterase PaaI-like protein
MEIYAITVVAALAGHSAAFFKCVAKRWTKGADTWTADHRRTAPKVMPAFSVLHAAAAASVADSAAGQQQH